MKRWKIALGISLTLLAALLVTFAYLCVNATKCAEAIPPREEVSWEVRDYPLIVKQVNAVEEQFQYPKYPSGCEPMSLSIVLHAWGVDMTVEDIIGTYLPIGGDYDTDYIGSVYGSGLASPSAMALAADKIFKENHIPLKALNISGEQVWDNIISAINQYPTMMWYTVDDSYPRFNGHGNANFKVYPNEHCLVAYAAVEGDIYISDPIAGYRKIKESTFKDIWERCGSMAVCIVPFYQ